MEIKSCIGISKVGKHNQTGLDLQADMLTKLQMFYWAPMDKSSWQILVSRVSFLQR